MKGRTVSQIDGKLTRDADAQVMSFAYDEGRRMHADASVLNKGALLEVTFEPTWVEGLEANEYGCGGATVAASFSVEDEDMKAFMNRGKRTRKANINRTRIEEFRALMGAVINGQANFTGWTQLREWYALFKANNPGFAAIAGDLATAMDQWVRAWITWTGMREEIDKIRMYEPEDVFASDALLEV